jgi:hypothetical protein
MLIPRLATATRSSLCLARAKRNVVITVSL